MSVGVWVVAQLPQMIKNQTRRHAEDLSIHFLALWLAGDMSNLAGCLLVDAALTQTVLGVYFVLSDLILLGQWWAFSGNATGPQMSKVSKYFWMAVGIIAIMGLIMCVLSGLTLSAIGDFLGWISGFIYLASRVPQIYQTFVTKHVEDLSIVLFACAVLGNSTYAASILTHSLNSEWLRKQAPFLLGSMGTLAFDAILVYQIVAYGTPTAKASPEIGDNH
jgi:uncharacterized protein with PQ loop repeat|eukprot:CAMPEP_0174303916 /NCGR_PEP_ID=MMETSP0809-20121228/60469_1 /TAXON_ID=73025 ORGANISM="Eutreptiella gymnastica-like, Strain CCMP1594" /NCGR_SAMPLE_ID=MMETSP0809 /ASSEMBLY_ACC=CAM_ASM_000658 /LENGTH=219 /DNA_ID=CAMNT_0015410031 /DNA_START=42 /DNA_END=701 /DNA_ORIENTATION=-